ncbi:MAG: ADP-ribosylglycohydrolase family protein [Clostridia bacterium]|nr:ADP-ribosylglycohydrolase family protein [Clostridia bacterium]
MWGAVIGDLAGSIYEYEQTSEVKSIKTDKIIPDNAFFSDDTILTIAILEAIQTDRNYEAHLKKYGNLYKAYKPNHKPYFKTSFSPGFTKWCESNEIGISIGNGAMMRISPVGFLFDNESEVKENAFLATVPSHNSKEAIVYSTLIALIIYHARNNMPKDEILKKLNIELKYKPFEKFNYTCSQTFDNCVFAAFNSESFEESICKVLSYGGDTDTNACIVGSMAEALYGIEPELIEKAKEYIPDEFTKILDKAYKNKDDVER